MSFPSAPQTPAQAKSANPNNNLQQLQQQKQNNHPHHQHILLTGATGFLGQAVLERLLQRENTTITLIVRAASDEALSARLHELFEKPVFNCWKQDIGENQAREQWKNRVKVIRGDLNSNLILPHDLTGVIHSASIVNFDEPIDSAFASNVAGPKNLYEALEKVGYCGNTVHVSTSYVQSNRVALAKEESVEHEHDWEHALAYSIACGNKANSAVALNQLSRRKADENLIEDGRKFAASLGFTDIYTTTKAMGERVAESFGKQQSMTIVRPTIIESAMSRPYPGWIDGFKVADPLIAAFAKGRLTQLPGHPDSVIDIIPVDVVVDSILNSLDNPPAVGETRYIQVGTSNTFPITLGNFKQIVEKFFEANPYVDSKGKKAQPNSFRFRSTEKVNKGIDSKLRTLSTASIIFTKLPSSRGVKSANRRVKKGKAELEVFRKFVRLYGPYTDSKTIYDSTATRLIRESHSDNHLDWDNYLTEVHLPAVLKMMTRASTIR